MEAIAEVILAIVAAFLELLVHLAAITMSLGWAARHARGVMRVALSITTLTAAWLFAGVSTPLWASPSIALSGAFSFTVLATCVVMMLFGIALSIAAHRVTEPEAPAKPGPVAKHPDLSGFVLYGFAILIVAGLVAVLLTQSHRSTLRERLCDAAEGRISESWKDRGSRALDLSEALLKKDFRAKLPCLDEAG
ncbi:hypothetical protein FHY55_13510 [Oceanicola sp. D3]|uniref:hypothetical protein n=1 Tax=Oceanicola sp. D3 TaxID=2587163 RepID=UPI00111D476A|nr:hypothetical protein [Oceanicola sp. D3]QDC10201.1 hypothetical protein FHY55_13510 [Oceanicola sp. D3]